MNDSNLNSIVAWWGAILASIVFLWDIYKWFMDKDKPELDITISTNMLVAGGRPDMDGIKYISLNVKNNGKLPTTLENVGLLFFKNKWLKIRNKPSKGMVVTNTGFIPIPHKLETGGVWTGVIEQTDDLVKMSNQGILLCGIYCSYRKKPFNVRINKIDN